VADQIVTKLRQIEVLQAQAKTIATAGKDAGTTEHSYYRWRNEYAALGVDQAKRLKQLETENGRLKKLVKKCLVDCHVSFSFFPLWPPAQDS
jgi:putative transposase